MAEYVVEDVRLLEIVHLLRPADPVGCREATVGEVAEEHVVGHEPRHSDDAPAGLRIQYLAQAFELGNAVGGDAEPFDAFEIFPAGAAGQEPRLHVEPGPPDRMGPSPVLSHSLSP